MIQASVQQGDLIRLKMVKTCHYHCMFYLLNLWSVTIFFNFLSDFYHNLYTVLFFFLVFKSIIVKCHWTYGNH